MPRLIPYVSAATLDTFRSEVYRPKLALLLLLIVVADPSLIGLPQSSSFGSRGSTTTTSSTGASTTPKHFQLKAQKQSVLAQPMQNQPSPGSFLTLPVPHLALLLHQHVLPPLVALHLLWAIRLAAMVMEDSWIKCTSKSRTSMLLIRLQLLVLALLTLFASSSNLFNFLRDVKVNFTSPSTLFAGAHSGSMPRSTPSTLPLLLIVRLEAFSTLFNLPLHLSGWLKPNVMLPSPSHAPKLRDFINPIVSALLAPSQYRRAHLAARQRGASARAAAAVSSTASSSSVGAAPARTGSLGLSQPIKSARRVKGMYVRVQTAWLSESIGVLASHLAASAIWTAVTLSLPSLSPTSLPPILALLSLRSELSAVASTWSRSRRHVECLEFVRRRWGGGRGVLRVKRLREREERLAAANGTGAGRGPLGGFLPQGDISTGGASTPQDSGDDTTSSRPAAQPEERFCPICFEAVGYCSLPPSADGTGAATSLTHQNEQDEEVCTLDCGHALHPLCLAGWLTAQSFCPTCHGQISAAPPGGFSAMRRAAQAAAAARRGERERERERGERRFVNVAR